MTLLSCFEHLSLLFLDIALKLILRDTRTILALMNGIGKRVNIAAAVKATNAAVKERSTLKSRDEMSNALNLLLFLTIANS